jgi:exopolyphosphatase/guanosine-5'-triphosphate,3'-diphosphate pyrophosphatase
MIEVVPRWEWRTFGDDLGAAVERLAATEPERTGETDELYLVWRTGKNTVKVRNDVLDVKRLEEVDDRGLERWKPVVKAPFPVSAADVRAACDALGLAEPELARPAYTLDQLDHELVRPAPELTSVAVHKLRRHYAVGGSMVEVSDVRAEGRETRTVAVESEDPARVAATLAELGLEGRTNTSYPLALRILVGFGAVRYAVIDVGTNSVKFHMAERRTAGDGGWTTVADRSEITRLGEGLEEGGPIRPEPMRRTIDAIGGMLARARRAGALGIAAVGTAGLRMAANRDEFVRAVEERFGVRVEVISGEEESRLGYLAVSSAVGPVEGSIAVFETGGGSSQFTFGRGEAVEERFSVNVGAARFTERFELDDAVGEDVVESAKEAIAAELERLEGRPPPDALIGIGGAFTNLAAVRHAMATYAPEVVEGTELDVAEIDRQIELYRTRTAQERRQIVGLQPARAEVILAGACIVRTALDKLGRESVTVSDRGLRHGLLLDRFGRAP